MASKQITTPPKVGVGILVRRGDEVLLGLRQGAHGAGEWAFPGGKLDSGESPADCANRELAEETGIVISKFRAVPLWTNDIFPNDNAHFVTLYMIGDCPSNQEPVLLEPDKCREWRWCKWEALPKPLFGGIVEVQSHYADLASI